MPERTAALTRDEARPLLIPLAGARGILIAVSGGPDSVALMRFIAELAAAAPLFPAIAVATVDHGLRGESRAEAEMVMTATAALGLPGHLLAWEGPKPTSGLQERARHHRYALLTDCARRIGASHLVTAHTLDDQAETVLFRLIRGSGLAGLAGMERETPRDGILHVRPFLNVAKARLVAACRTNGWPFVDDPGNTDPRFARARLRALMPALAVEGLDAARFARLARRMGEAEVALGEAARRAIRQAEIAPGVHDVRRLFTEPMAVRQRIVAVLLTDLGAMPGRPRLDRVERLTQTLCDAVAASRPLRRTLHGASVSFDGHDRLTIAPAPPRRGSTGSAIEPD